MNFFLIQAILIAGIDDENSRFWMQIMVFLIMAAGWGVYSLVKNDLSKRKVRQQNLTEESSPYYAKSRWRFRLPHKPNILDLSQEPMPGLDNPDTSARKKPKNKPAGKKTKDLQSGMELLEVDFLLSIIENTKSNSRNDVAMRKLNFNEVFRRDKLSIINSKVLTVYTVDRSNLYGKDIQCKAMQELAKRTIGMIRDQAVLPAVSTKKRKRMVRIK